MPTIKKTQVEFEGHIEERQVIVEEEHVEPWEQDAELRLVGQGLARVDGVARVTGQAVYTIDLQLPGMLIGGFLRSPHAHARLRQIDSQRAESLPGVWRVWHRDQPPPIRVMAEREIFAEELAYEGAEVAFVVANDRNALAEALAAIEVEYEVLPFVKDLQGALTEDGPAALSDESNLINPDGSVYERGNIEEGLREAEVVIDRTFSTPIAAHCCLEPHGSAARWEGDELTLWHSTQGVFAARSSIAQALNISQDRVRVICDYIGGGFGAKSDAENYSLMAALAARETGRPVKVILSRHEEHLVAGYRPSSHQRVRLGARRDGTLTFIEHDAWEVTGAYGGEGYVIDGPTKDLYACPNVRTAVRAIRANTDHARAFRAPGYVEGIFALESTMDALAEALEMDPLALRLHNYAETSPQRDTPYTAKGLREAYRIGAERIDWQNRHEKERDAGLGGPWRRGWGMASQIWGGGGGPPANALVKLLPDGTAEVIAGVQEIGTGTKTVLAQLAAEELGLAVDQVRVVVGDTRPAPYGPTSAGSMTVASVGPAVRSAARQALEEFLEIAAHMLELPDKEARHLKAKDGEIYDERDPQKCVPFPDVGALMGGYTIVGDGARGPNPEDKAVNTFGAHFVEVAVNVETGQVRVERIVAVHEIGRVINPLTAANQVYGGVIQSLGFGTMEERVLDPQTGLQLTANLEDYRIPTMADVPEIEVIFVDEADPAANSVGAKGLGEPPIIPTAAAIANAIADASGVRLAELPMTPDRVLRALRARQEEKK